MNPIALAILSFAAMGVFAVIVYAFIILTTDAPYKKSEKTTQTSDTIAISALHMALSQRSNISNVPARFVTNTPLFNFGIDPTAGIKIETVSSVLNNPLPGAGISTISPQTAVAVENLLRKKETTS